MTNISRQDDLKSWIDRQTRRAVDFVAFLHRRDGSRRSVRISNLSYDGCQIDGAAVAVGDPVKLHLAGLGEVEAEVRWVAGDRAGARFVDHQ